MQVELFFRTGLVLVSTTVLVAVVIGCVNWIQWLRGGRKRNLCGDPASHELVTSCPRVAPRWSVFDFILMFGIMVLVGSLLQSVSRVESKGEDALVSASVPAETQDSAIEDAPQVNELPENEPPETASSVDESPSVKIDTATLARKIQIHFTANLASLILTLTYLRLAYGATLSHLTLIPNWLDLRRGLHATVWILAPVLLINFLISNLVEYEHPVTDLLGEDGGTVTFLGLFLSAAVLTPIVEEFQFRLLLQDGLQQFADPPPIDGQASWIPRTAWPIFVTSGLFALMHLGQGAAPIPLFFLSLGLGYLYQRTGRLFPAITVHMLLNGATLVMEFCRVNSGF